MEPEQVAQFLDTLRSRKLNEVTLHLVQELWYNLEKKVPRFEGRTSYGPALNWTVAALEHSMEHHPMTTDDWNALATPLSILISILLKFISLDREAVNTSEKAETVMKIATIFLSPCQQAENLKISMAKTNGLRILRLICWEELEFPVRKKIYGPFRDALLSTTARHFSRSSGGQVLIERLVGMFERTADLDFQEHTVETLLRFALARTDWQNELKSFFKNNPEIGAESHIINPHQFVATRKEFLTRANKLLPPTRRVFSLECIEAHADGIPLQKPQEYSHLWLDLSPLTGNVQLTFALESGDLGKISVDVEIVTAIETSIRPSADEIEVTFLFVAPGIFVPFEPDVQQVSALTAILKKDERFTEAEVNFFVHAYPDKYKPARLQQPEAKAEEELNETEFEPETARSAVSPILMFHAMERSGFDMERREADKIIGRSSISPGASASTNTAEVAPRSSVTGGIVCPGITCPDSPICIKETSEDAVIDLTVEDSECNPEMNISVDKPEDHSTIDSTTETSFDWDTELSIPQFHCSEADFSSHAVPSCDMLEEDEPANIVHQDYQNVQSSADSPSTTKCLDYEPVFGEHRNLQTFEELSQKSDHQMPLIRPPSFVVPDAAKLPSRRKDTSHSESERSASSTFPCSTFSASTTVRIKPPVIDLNNSQKRFRPTENDDVYCFVDDETEQPADLGKRAAPPKKPTKRMLYTPGKGDLHDDVSLKSDQSIDTQLCPDIRQNIFAKAGSSQGIDGVDKEKAGAGVGRKRKSSPSKDSLPPSKRQQQLSISNGSTSNSSHTIARRSPAPRRAKGDGVVTRGLAKKNPNPMFFSTKVKESHPSLATPQRKKRQRFVKGRGGRSFAKRIMASSAKSDPLRSEAPVCLPTVGVLEPEVKSTDNLIHPPPMSPPTNNFYIIPPSPPPPVEPLQELEVSSDQSSKKPGRGRPKKVTSELKTPQKAFSPKDLNRTRTGRHKNVSKEQTYSPKGAASTSSGLGSLEGSDISPVVVGHSKKQVKKEMSASHQPNGATSVPSPRRSQRLNQSQTLERALPSRSKKQPMRMSPSHKQNDTGSDRRVNTSQTQENALPTRQKNPRMKNKSPSHRQRAEASDSSPSYVTTRARRLKPSQAHEPEVSDRKTNRLMNITSLSKPHNGATSNSSSALNAMQRFSQVLNQSLAPTSEGSGFDPTQISNPVLWALQNMQDVPLDCRIGSSVEHDEPVPPRSNPSTSAVSTSCVARNNQVFPPHFLRPGDPTPEFSSEHNRRLHDLASTLTDLFTNEIRQREADPYDVVNLTLDSMRTNLHTIMKKFTQWYRTIIHCTDTIRLGTEEMSVAFPVGVDLANLSLDSMRTKLKKFTEWSVTVLHCTETILRIADEMSVSFEVVVEMLEAIDEHHRESLRSSTVRQNDPRTYSKLRQQILQVLKDRLPDPSF